MFTHMFQFLIFIAAITLAVEAVLTYLADRREIVERADRAFLEAHVFIDRRFEAGFYQPSEIATMKKDFDNKYIELISN